MVQEFSSVLVVAALKFILGEVIQRFNLRRANVVLLLQEVEVVGLVLFEQLDKIGIHEKAHNAVCLSLQVNTCSQRDFPLCRNFISLFDLHIGIFLSPGSELKG